MKKVVIIIISIIIVIGTVISGIEIYKHYRDKNPEISNDEAEQDEKNRYLTIINDTAQIINEVHIVVGEGTEIEHAYQKNPNKNSYSIKIEKAFEEYEDFTVILIDRYGLKYQKDVTGVKREGRTEVKITEDNYVKQKGDLKRKIDRFFNGD